MTTVVHIRKDHYEVYIGRPSVFGNPYRLSKGDIKGSTLRDYKHYFYSRIENDATFRTQILALKGKILGCHCKPGPCHGDIIADYLNNL